MADVENAVFKTVCGTLLRRPGWVRFPSIPAKVGGHDSQHDSHSSERRYTSPDGRGRAMELGTDSPARTALRPGCLAG
jgi:hypothetical protein